MQLGGMSKFVANGWAAKDYTHINFQGGSRIAQELAMAIQIRVYKVVYEREVEQARLEELERQRRELAERYLQLQIDAVQPIINGVEQSLIEVAE